MAGLLRCVSTLLLAAGVLLAPLACGSTPVWAYASLQIGVALAAAVWALSAPRDRRFLLLTALLIGLVLLQLLPVPAAVRGTLSSLAAAGDAKWGCFSVEPGSTASGLRQGVVLLLVVAMVADLARQRASRALLAWSVAAAGLLVLALGCRFPRAGEGVVLGGLWDMHGPSIYWKNSALWPVHSQGFGYTDEVRVGAIRYACDWFHIGDPVGPYLVSNHFAGCLGLTLPVALGLVLAVRARGRVAVAFSSAAVLAAALGCVALVLTLSHSRAGAASLAIGLLVLGWSRADRPASRRVWAALTLAAAGACLLAISILLFVDFAASPPGRLPGSLQSRLGALDASLSGRMAMVRACGTAFAQAPVTGTGLGTFRPVARYLQPIEGHWAFAHNALAQWLAETGLPGVVLAGLAIFLAWRRTRIGWKRTRTPSGRALRAGLLGALSAAGLHGLFDWNLHVPANAFLAAVVLGLLLAMAPPRRADAVGASPARRGRRRCLWTSGVVVGLAVLVACDAWRHIQADRLVEPLRHVLAAQRRRPSRGAGLEREGVREAAPMTAPHREVLEGALASAHRAAELDPLSADYAESIAHGHLHRSEGTGAFELETAAAWYRRTLRLSPLRVELHDTLGDIEQQLERLKDTSRRAAIERAP